MLHKSEGSFRKKLCDGFDDCDIYLHINFTISKHLHCTNKISMKTKNNVICLKIPPRGITSTQQLF